MKIYLVGGAVRNRLLGFPINDRDWVVVGSSPQDMLKKKYQQVGKDFPVFIHPITHEEYALARTEKKNGLGYLGFLCNFSPNITLKEDLMRRDLTINSMAQDESGKIIDFFGGQKDIKRRVLRHVSSSFKEDPLRVLRVARFAAMLSHLGFYISKKTLSFMKSICNSKELLYLTPERIWKETYKGLCTPNPQVYFQVLHRCNALMYLFPEINYFYSREFSSVFANKYINIVNKSFIQLSRVSKKTQNVDIRLAYFFQFVGQIYFFSHMNKKNIFFCKNSVFLLNNLFKRLKVPKETQKFSILLCGFHYFLQTIEIQSSELIVNFFNIMDLWRKPNRVDQLLYLDFDYDLTFYKSINRNKSLGFLLQRMFLIVKTVSIDSLSDKKLFQGIQIKNELYRLRVQRLQQWRKNNF
ncbi:CCA-adding protein [Buchnera aphidicola]|uniref:CCA-adding enzyme n=1 Tax=Buchnera aphidicola (Cinara strobi) TaxID=1921549 RepID=A0A3B1E9B3_9GAMM|nr:CCA-adding protein [Buchnera aphidicola]VAX76249.1 Multifunctional CCA protein [Buchnera aphidicola (Cinara strobi)]